MDQIRRDADLNAMCDAILCFTQVANGDEKVTCTYTNRLGTNPEWRVRAGRLGEHVDNTLTGAMNKLHSSAVEGAAEAHLGASRAVEALKETQYPGESVFEWKTAVREDGSRSSHRCTVGDYVMIVVEDPGHSEGSLATVFYKGEVIAEMPREKYLNPVDPVHRPYWSVEQAAHWCMLEVKNHASGDVNKESKSSAELGHQGANDAGAR